MECLQSMLYWATHLEWYPNDAIGVISDTYAFLASQDDCAECKAIGPKNCAEHGGG